MSKSTILPPDFDIDQFISHVNFYHANPEFTIKLLNNARILLSLIVSENTTSFLRHNAYRINIPTVVELFDLLDQKELIPDNTVRLNLTVPEFSSYSAILHKEKIVFIIKILRSKVSVINIYKHSHDAKSYSTMKNWVKKYGTESW